jgi:3-hydroxyacyl-[acyl-carrier-protein] dehydratase
MAPTDQDILNLRTSLKRCSADTVEAAVRFRLSGDAREIPTIVYGIIERHLSPEHNRNLSSAGDETRLIEDLGIDSLTLLEIVLSIEETLSISIENEELREILTLGQVKTFIGKKIAGPDELDADAAGQARKYSRDEILLRLPQQPPFFFLDGAQIDGHFVRAQYKVRGDEFFLEGHFKDNPVMPASIVFEAIGQAACLWVLECAPAQLHVELQSSEVLFASMEEAHFYRRAKPGDVLDLEAEMVRLRAPLAIFRGSAKLRGEKLAQIEHLVLAFGQEVVEHLGKREHESAAAELPAGHEQNGAGPAPGHEIVPSRKDLQRDAEVTGPDVRGRN